MNLSKGDDVKENILIIVTQCNLRFGYNVVKNLIAHGYKIVALGDSLPTMCANMPGVIAEAVYPDPFSDPMGYINAINLQAKQYKKAIFIPVHEDIFIAAKYKNHFNNNLSILVPPYSHLISLHDKFNLYEISKGFSFSSPFTTKITDILQIEKIINANPQQQYILKPQFGEGTRGVFKVCKRSFPKLKGKINRHIQQQNYLLQIYVNGKGVCVGLLASNGRLIARSAHIRLREVPCTGGTSTARKTFSSTSLFSEIEKFIHQIQFSGILMLEFRFDETRNNYYLIDANPRYWGGLSTHIHSGVEYPLLHVRLALGELPKTIIESSKTVESRWFLGEIRYFIEKLFSLRPLQCLQIFYKEKDVDKVFYEDFQDGFRTIFAQIKAYAKRITRIISSNKNARKTFFQKQDLPNEFEKTL